MVRPTADSLNSRADLLRRAQPLYAEYRLILNYLDDSTGVVKSVAIEALEQPAMNLPANDDALITHRAVLELEPISKRADTQKEQNGRTRRSRNLSHGKAL